MKTFHLTLLCAFLVLGAGPAHAATWIVDQSGLEDFTSIQEAVDAASMPDTILVRPGTYHERVSFFQDKSGILLKGDGPVADVVIDADTLVVGFWDTDPAVRVENLTLTGSNLHGALWIQGSKVEIVGCVIRDNVGPGSCNGVGGGGKAYFFSDILVEGCVFEGNHSWESPGGFIVWGSRADIRNNIFRNNSSCYGGGLEMYHCEDNGVSVIEGNLFLNNDADTWGGGLFNVDSSPIIRNNTFVGNGGAVRAAIAVLGGAPDIHHNIFVDSDQAIFCQADPKYPPSLPVIGDNICWEITQPGLSNCPSTAALRVANPLFCDAGAGDYTVCDDSPAVVGGEAVYGAFGVGCAACSQTPVKKTTWGALKRLLDKPDESP
jgi:hypothetical protein